MKYIFLFLNKSKRYRTKLCLVERTIRLLEKIYYFIIWNVNMSLLDILNLHQSFANGFSYFSNHLTSTLLVEVFFLISSERYPLRENYFPFSYTSLFMTDHKFSIELICRVVVSHSIFGIFENVLLWWVEYEGALCFSIVSMKNIFSKN